MKKEGSVRKRGSNVEVRVWIDGKQKSFYGKTEAEARRKIREYRNEQKEKKTEQTGGNELFGEYVFDYLMKYKYQKIKDSSFDILERVYYNQLSKYKIAGIKLKDLTVEQMQEYLNSINEKYSNSILKKVLEIITPPLKLAVVEKKLPFYILDFVIIPRKKNIVDIDKPEDEKFIYTEEEVERLTKVCVSKYGDNTRDNKRYRYAPSYVLLLNTGMRIGELTALTWSDIDFVKKTIRINKTTSTVKNRGEYNTTKKKVDIVTTPKTPNSNRYIPMNETASNVLLELKRRQELESIKTNFVVSNPDGDMMSVRVMEQTFKRICEENGICSKGLHALRHTFGSMLLVKGVDIKIISKTLGHSTVKFTYDRYIHIINNMEAQAINLLNVSSF